MEFRIFNVGHGFCALLVADNGNVMLFDCGHDDWIGFRPSKHLRELGCSAISRLIISNYDEDHISDLHRLASVLDIRTLCRNKSIPPQSLRQLKFQGGPLSPSMETLLDMHERYTAPVSPPLDFAGVELVTFHNPYPTFQDTNNLSLVSFIRYSDLCIMCPGDLEKPGWAALLRKPDFRRYLGQVSVFIASHHGRENGYLREVFDFCDPDIVIISDESKQYQTQETDYADHARGIRFNNGRMRYVLTTRRDGNITVTKSRGRGGLPNRHRRSHLNADRKREARSVILGRSRGCTGESRAVILSEWHRSAVRLGVQG